VNSQQVVSFLEREGLLISDSENDYLALDGPGRRFDVTNSRAFDVKGFINPVGAWMHRNGKLPTVLLQVTLS